MLVGSFLIMLRVDDVESESLYTLLRSALCARSGFSMCECVSFSKKFSPVAAFSQKKLPRNKQLIDIPVQNQNFNVGHGPKKLLKKL